MHSTIVCLCFLPLPSSTQLPNKFDRPIFCLWMPMALSCQKSSMPIFLFSRSVSAGFLPEGLEEQDLWTVKIIGLSSDSQLSPMLSPCSRFCFLAAYFLLFQWFRLFALGLVFFPKLLPKAINVIPAIFLTNSRGAANSTPGKGQVIAAPCGDHSERK